MDERTIGKQIILGRIIKYVSDCVINEKAPYIKEEKLYQWFDENSICLQEMIYVYRGTHIDRMAQDVYNILTQNGDEDAYKTKAQESITSTQESRQKYLQSLVTPTVPATNR